MKCTQADELMMNFFDGEINDLDLYHFKHHLKNCNTCSKQYDLLSTILNYMEDQPTLDAPENLESSVIEKIAMTEAKKTHVKSGYVILCTVITGFIVMITTLFSIFMQSISVFDITNTVADIRYPTSLLSNSLLHLQYALTEISVLAGSVFNLYYALTKNYYDVLFMMVAIIIVVYTMSDKILKHDLGMRNENNLKS